MRRERTLAAAAYVGVLLVWFWPLLKGWQLGQSHVLWLSHPWSALKPAALDLPGFSGEGDASNVFQPILSLARQQLSHGHLPLWNPYIYGGMPLIGDIQSALFHPITWLGLVLGAQAGAGPMAAAKLLVAALGARELSRRVGLSARAAWFAGLVFAFSAPLLAWLQWPLTTVFAMFGWLLWATHGVVRRPGRRSVGALGLVVGVSILAGHPETAFLSTAAAAVYGAMLLATEHGSTRWRGASAWAVGHVLGTAIAAVALVPFALAYRDSLTQAVHGEQATIHLPVRGLLTWFVPGIFGDGRPEYRGPLGTWVVTAASVGSVTLLLAGVAVVRDRRARGPGLALTVMSALALAVVFAVPPVSWITRAVPPFSTGNNVRILYVPALALAVGAGMGIDALARRGLTWRRAAVAAVALLAFTGLLLIGAQAFGALPGPGSTALAAAGRTALFTLLGGVCLVALSGRRGGLALALAAVVVLADLSVARSFNAVLPADQAYVSSTPAVRFLQRRLKSLRLSTVRPGPFPPYVLPPDTNTLYGLDAIQGYDYPESKRWADFSWFVLGERGVQREIILTSPKPGGPALPALRLMGTGWYIGAPGASRPGPALQLAYDGPDARIWRDPGALPRAYVLGRVRSQSDAAALRTLERGGLDPRREAIVPPGALIPGAGDKSGFRRAQARQVSPLEWRVHVGGGPAGWLVLANAYSSEWRARVDGRDAEIRPTNFAAMGVPLGPGRHRIDFTMRTAPFWVGAALTLLALLTTAGLLVWPSRRVNLRA